jgi:predicted transcriptional regulator
MVIAMKHGNRLTVPRLALEMDITLEKAEKIIDKLVKNGVAEIDLEDRDSDGALTYKIKGI